MKLTKTESKTLGAEGGKWLRGLIDVSIAKDESYFKFFRNVRNLLSGKHWENVKKKSKEDIKMVINLAHAHVRTLLPTLFFQNPSLDCAPTAPQHAGKEQIYNGVINNTLDKTGFAEECKQVVLDSCFYPEAVLKDIVNKVDEAGNGAGPTSESSSRGPTVWLDKGAPVHVRLSPAQLIVDYLVPDRNVDNARFIAIRSKRLLSELKLDPKYADNIEADLKPTLSPFPTTGNAVGKRVTDVDDWDEPRQKSSNLAEEDLVTIFEVWIHQLIENAGKWQVRRKMCVLIDGQDKPIKELTSWDEVMGEGFDTFPVTRLVLNPVPDESPQSELAVWQDMQYAIDWLISRVTQLVENDRLLYAADSGKIKNFAKFREEFYKGRSRQLVEVDGPDALTLLQPSFAGRDNYTLLNLMNTYIQQVSGFGQNRRGGSGIRTATEASIVETGTQLKTDEKVDAVSKFLIRVLTKNAKMTRALVKQDKGVAWVFRLNGSAGAVRWINFTAEDINWMPEIRIRVNSFRKMDSTQEMQKYAGLIQIATNMFQLYGPRVRVDILFQRMLEAAGIFDAEKIVGGFDAQMMLQMIEISGIIAGVATPVTEEQNHAAHMQVLDAFMQSQIGMQIMQGSPDVAERLMMHRQEHEQALMIAQEKAARAQQAADPFASAGASENPTPQSTANGATAEDRTPVQSVPGG